MTPVQAMEINLKHQYKILRIYLELGKLFIEESEKRLFGRRKLLRLTDEVLEKIHREKLEYFDMIIYTERLRQEAVK